MRYNWRGILDKKEIEGEILVWEVLYIEFYFLLIFSWMDQQCTEQVADCRIYRPFHKQNKEI